MTLLWYKYNIFNSTSNIIKPLPSLSESIEIRYLQSDLNETLVNVWINFQGVFVFTNVLLKKADASVV